jgi:hypothetical protein
MTPAEEMAAAADKLDALAAIATPVLSYVEDGHILPEDYAYYAAMSPLVSKALADTLRIRADQLRHDRRVEGSHPLTAKLLDLARLINGGAS